MRASKNVATLAALTGWIYSWSVIRQVRSEFAFGDLGPMPLWLILLMGGTSTLLIAAALAAGMGAPIWPLVAGAAGPAFLALIVLGQRSVMRHPHMSDPVGIADALNAALRVRSPLSVAIFVAGVPTALILSSLTWTIRSRVFQTGEQGA